MCCSKAETEASVDCDALLFARIEIPLLVTVKPSGDKPDADCCSLTPPCGGKILCDIVNFIPTIILMSICSSLFGRKYRKRKITFEFIHKNVYVEATWTPGPGARFQSYRSKKK